MQVPKPVKHSAYIGKLLIKNRFIHICFSMRPLWGADAGGGNHEGRGWWEFSASSHYYFCYRSRGSDHIYARCHREHEPWA